jgi:hypothetical protein
MAARLGLFLALNLLFLAGATHGCTTPYCGPADPTPPVEPPAPSTYAPEPPAPTMPVAPTPSSYAPQSPAGRCQVDVLQLQVCASILDGLVKVSLPEERAKCCQLLNGLADIDAAACLCTVLKANVLDISLRVPINISLSLWL